MRLIIKWLIYIASALLGAFAVFFGYAWCTEWIPQPKEIVETKQTFALSSNVQLPDTLKIVSWNIGYAGLGDDMDFFYDGGKTNRTSEERTIKNLQKIIDFLAQHADADFITLQEVDRNSNRSYYVDQMESISEVLPDFTAYFACNYKSFFVPIPILDPIGKVEAGLVTLTKYPVKEAIRWSFPGGFDFPVRMFNLKRCMLSLQIALPNGDFYLNNVHNTAYDSGGMREKEIEFLRNFLIDRQLSVTVGDWNCNPPGYKASREELQNEFFAPIQIQETDFPLGFSYACDPTKKTSRYGYEPYIKGKTVETNIDFALLGNGFYVVDVKVIDLGYESSDHNPVIYKIARAI